VLVLKQIDKACISIANILKIKSPQFSKYSTNFLLSLTFYLFCYFTKRQFVSNICFVFSIDIFQAAALIVLPENVDAKEQLKRLFKCNCEISFMADLTLNRLK
jgi:hypothetical protein